MGTVLFICTGNAARSVMAGALMHHLRPDLTVETGGTLVVEGMPFSLRTKAAIDALGLPMPEHRSQQSGPVQFERCDLIVGLAPEHVRWVRQRHPRFAPRSSTLVHLSEALEPGPDPLEVRIGRMDLAARPLDPAEEVPDPAGGEEDEYIACARIVEKLVRQLAPLL